MSIFNRNKNTPSMQDDDISTDMSGDDLGGAEEFSEDDGLSAPSSVRVSSGGSRRGLLLSLLVILGLAGGGGYFYLSSQSDLAALTPPAGDGMMPPPDMAAVPALDANGMPIATDPNMMAADPNAMPPMPDSAQAGVAIDPTTGLSIDPATGAVIADPMAQPAPIDPTVQPAPIDPTAQAVDPMAPSAIDPTAPPTDMTATDPTAISAVDPALDPMAQPAPIDPTAQPAPIDPTAQPAPIDPTAQSAPIDPTAQPAPIDPTAQSAQADPMAPPTDMAATDPTSIPAVDPNAATVADPAAMAQDPAMAINDPSGLAQPSAEQPPADAMMPATTDTTATSADTAATPAVTDPAVPPVAETAATTDGAAATTDPTAPITATDPATASAAGDGVTQTAAPANPYAPEPADALIRPLPNQYLEVKKEKGSDTLDARLATARRALNEGRTAAALSFFEDIHRDFPSDRRVLMGRALAMQKLGQPSEALAAYEDVLRVDPKNLDAVTNMLGLLKQQNPGLAIEKLSELRAAYPFNHTITTQLAIAHGSAGNNAEALRYLTLAEGLKPGDTTLMYNKAVLLDKMGRSLEAADLYRALIRMSSEGRLQQPLPIEQMRQRLGTLR